MIVNDYITIDFFPFAKFDRRFLMKLNRILALLLLLALAAGLMTTAQAAEKSCLSRTKKM